MQAGEEVRADAGTVGLKPRLVVFIARHRWAVHAFLDAVAVVAAFSFATALRYDFTFSQNDIDGLVYLLPVAVLVHLVAGLRFGLYNGRWRFGSFEEVMALVKASAVSTLVVFAFNPVWQPRLLPLSVPVVAGIFSLVVQAGFRYSWRLAMERRLRPCEEGRHRLLVFGAGEGGTQVIAALLRDPTSEYVPVGLLDDDPDKRNLRLMGVPVLGSRTRLAEAAADCGADTLLIAVPSADADLVGDLSDRALAANLAVKVLPPVRELFQGQVDVDDIRDVTTADLLGRHEINTDIGAIAGYLAGKRVLVTGAGGSIGSELCRQIYRFAPAQLIMLDRDESALHGVQLSIDGRALLDSPDLVLLDIRDRAALRETIHRLRPHVVFHAAALKHLVMLERHPAEAVKTNIVATLDLLELCAEVGVGRFVNISTDKAADPCSVLGYSKRITERLTSYFSDVTEASYLSVRFGNVLGSRGSVMTTFQAQVDRGGPITVTDEAVTRFFMTVEEAVQLVVQAGAIGRPGEALVLDMGKAVSIAEVARLVAARSERKVGIEFTGLRPGEKMHEVLLAEGEVDHRPIHPLISQVPVPPVHPLRIRAIDLTASASDLVGQMAILAASEGSDAAGASRASRAATRAPGGRS
jgi:FlaA1/EpsC-like NDP-sugar epimerase